MRLSLVLTTLLLAANPCPADAAEPSLESLKQTYETEVQKIRDEHEVRLKGLLDAYGRSLDKAIEILKREGDPDRILEAHSEKRRFEEEQDVPTKPDAELPAVLQMIQSDYNDALKKANVDKGQKFVALTKRYIEALDRLMRSLAAQDKLDLSLNVKAEKKRVEFVLAEVGVQVERLGASVAAPGRKAGQEMTIDLGGSVKMVFVWIPPGTFDMGSPATESGRDVDEGPMRRVTLTRGFWIGKHEVTQEQYERVMGRNPSEFKRGRFPVETVNWTDARTFCKAMATRIQKLVRLPTEAEWEYACRAGTSTPHYLGTSESDLAKAAWYHRNSGGQTHTVGLKVANDWGLHDMLGNVWEWCEDWYGSYTGLTPTNPRGPASGPFHVKRGGCWTSAGKTCRAAFRHTQSHKTIDSRNSLTGLRLVLPSD